MIPPIGALGPEGIRRDERSRSGESKISSHWEARGAVLSRFKYSFEEAEVERGVCQGIKEGFEREADQEK